MAGLSSNWKKLQTKLKEEERLSSSLKRKADDPSTRHRQAKKQKVAAKPVTATRNQDTNRSSRPEMGGVQSSSIESEPRNGPFPSLALWTGDSEISAEALAEAYGLGLKGDSTAKNNDRINYGLSTDVQIGKFVALDCEMVGVGSGGYESALARASLVDFHGRQIYDSFVKQKERVTDWRTPVSGVSPKDMRLARDFDVVQAQVSDLLKDRVLVGHDIRHDLAALKLSHPSRDIRDTAKYPGFGQFANGRRPALKVLAKELLGAQIQDGPHSSVEDARVTMLLFRKHKSGFDAVHANRYGLKRTGVTHRKGKRMTQARRGG
ncbi:hypothetical protein XA68_16406 [Ophiocordyceps unilateralis]|uniref:RNA exonuclease 4 n=1 Tax=Ophiocordyceps unilateralis TaxID=268505 RepID=A0A2A9P4Z4_OPHUN|nr:hypothetical protein XA68_16406 [Ophiocordyceps unilateralis]